MKKISWKTEKRKVGELKPAEYNPRALTDKQRTDLTASVQEFGEVEPVVVNTNGTIVGGHQRIKVYADLGIKEITVRVPNRKLNETEEKRLNLRLNKNVAEWDFEKLKAMDMEMLLDVGFGDDELSAMWDDMLEIEDDEFNVEKAVREAKTTTIKKGDLFELGSHRLLCGDSTDPTQVKKLMGGNLADCIYNDPPYNIGLDYSRGIGAEGKYQGKFSAKNDSKKEKEYSEFLAETIQNAVASCKKDAHIFYWCDESYIWMLQTLFRNLGITNRRVCFWVKNNQNPTPQVAFNKAIETCVYGTIGQPWLNNQYKNLNEILNKEVESGNSVLDEILSMINIWIAKRDNAVEYEHPTQKPLTLHEKPLKRCTKPGNIVLDLFGGSGSTLMACEALKRRAYLQEVDPIFCQVIINRYEQAGGKINKIS